MTKAKQFMEEPNCKNCYDKGYFTQMYGLVGSPDFIGDKGLVEAPSVHKNYCNCELGKTMEKKEIIEQSAKEANEAINKAQESIKYNTEKRDELIKKSVEVTNPHDKS